MGEQIDAVTVSMPDHNHAVMAAKAMKMGKHVHCQKPLTHSIWEARRLGEIASEKGVATQMGNQWTGVQSDAQGRLSDSRRPARHREGSAHLDEPADLAARRTSRHQRSRCRRRSTGKPGSARRHFGRMRTATIRSNGAAGGTSAPVRSATWLATRATCRSWRSTCATRSRSRPNAPEHDGDSYPARSKIKFEFPKLGDRPAFTMHWYDGGNLPPNELFKGVTLEAKSDDKEGQAAAVPKRRAAYRR